MEKILESILKELEYQTKLMEELYKKPNPNTDAINKQMNLMKTMLNNNPAFKNNPQAAGMLKDIFDAIPKGGQ